MAFFSSLHDSLKIVFFVVILSMFIGIIIPEDYKKYINVYIGICILIILLNPFLELNKNLKIDFFKQIYMVENDIAKNSSNNVDMYRKMVIEEYKSKLINQIKENIKNNIGLDIQIEDVVINENIDSKDFGKIIKIIIQGKHNEEICRFLNEKYMVEKSMVIFKEVSSIEKRYFRKDDEHNIKK